MPYKIPLIVAIAALMAVGSVIAVVNGPASRPAANRAVSDLQGQATQLSADQVRLQQAAMLAAAGRGAIGHVAAARRLLATDKTDEAAASLAVAARILAQIKLAEDEGGAAESAPGDERPGVDGAADGRPGDARMIPLIARLGLPDQTDLSDRLKQSLNRLAPMVAAGDHAQVVAALKDLDIPMTYSYVEMPLKVVTDEVAAAARAIEAGDRDGADAYLKAAIDANVSTTVTIGEQPGDRQPAPAVPVAAESL